MIVDKSLAEDFFSKINEVRQGTEKIKGKDYFPKGFLIISEMDYVSLEKYQKSKGENKFIAGDEEYLTYLGLIVLADPRIIYGRYIVTMYPSEKIFLNSDSVKSEYRRASNGSNTPDGSGSSKDIPAEPQK